MEAWGTTFRHLFQLLKVKFGDATAFVPQGQLQQGLSRKAFQGPVRIRPEARVSPGVVIPLTVAAWFEDEVGGTTLRSAQGGPVPEGKGRGQQR